VSNAIPSLLILCVAGCGARPANPPAAGTTATVFEGARLITGDEVPPIEDSAFVVEVEGPTRSNVPP